jgi:hypothetical protein
MQQARRRGYTRKPTPLPQLCSGQVRHPAEMLARGGWKGPLYTPGCEATPLPHLGLEVVATPLHLLGKGRCYTPTPAGQGSLLHSYTCWARVVAALLHLLGKGRCYTPTPAGQGSLLHPYTCLTVAAPLHTSLPHLGLEVVVGEGRRVRGVVPVAPHVACQANRCMKINAKRNVACCLPSESLHVACQGKRCMLPVKRTIA